MMYRIELNIDDRLEHSTNKFFQRVLKAFIKSFGWTEVYDMVEHFIRLKRLEQVKRDGTEVWVEVKEFVE